MEGWRGWRWRGEEVWRGWRGGGGVEGCVEGCGGVWRGCEGSGEEEGEEGEEDGLTRRSTEVVRNTCSCVYMSGCLKTGTVLRKAVHGSQHCSVSGLHSVFPD